MQVCALNSVNQMFLMRAWFGSELLKAGSQSSIVVVCWWQQQSLLGQLEVTSYCCSWKPKAYFSRFLNDSLSCVIFSGNSLFKVARVIVLSQELSCQEFRLQLKQFRVWLIHSDDSYFILICWYNISTYVCCYMNSTSISKYENIT